MLRFQTQLLDSAFVFLIAFLSLLIFPVLIVINFFIFWSYQWLKKNQFCFKIKTDWNANLYFIFQQIAYSTQLVMAKCSEFTPIFYLFSKNTNGAKSKTRCQYSFSFRENALNPSYIRNTSDWLLKYDVIELFCLLH